MGAAPTGALSAVSPGSQFVLLGAEQVDTPALFSKTTPRAVGAAQLMWLSGTSARRSARTSQSARGPECCWGEDRDTHGWGAVLRYRRGRLDAGKDVGLVKRSQGPVEVSDIQGCGQGLKALVKDCENNKTNKQKNRT